MTHNVGISIGGIHKDGVDAVSAAIQRIMETPNAENKTKVAALKALRALTRIPDVTNTAITGCSIILDPTKAPEQSEEL